MDFRALKPIAVATTLLALYLCDFYCQASSHSLLTKFNCKKIAFYKTHKTGSTTLGGILFRIAVSSNMSMYMARSHYLNIGATKNDRLLGRSDLVLRHIRFSDSPGFHAATRSFYGRALGTAEYGFLTVLRNPIDRYISDFYYFEEPNARRARKKLTLEKYVEDRKGGNRMAGEFAVRDARVALEFVTSEMQADGVFLPLELLDYGLALLAAHCGWRMSQIMYLPANSNTAGKERYGRVSLKGRPSLGQLMEQEPALVNRIANLNSLDAVFYSAAVSQLLERLQPSGPSAASASAVMAGAVRLMVARKHLAAECRALRSGSEPPSPSPPPRALVSADDLAGVCAWFEVLDTDYEKMPDSATGRVALDAELKSPTTTPPSWPVGRLLRLANEHLALYDDPSVPYYHSLLAVYVRPPTVVDSELVYGMAGGNGGGSGEEALAAAVRLWTLHHAGEGLHHLVFFVDAATEEQHEQVVRQAATTALGGALSGPASYTTFSVIRCSGFGDVDAASAGGCDSEAGFHEMIRRSRWSAVLPGLMQFLYGTRGSVRSVLLSYEALLHGASAVCAPLVRWQTALVDKVDSAGAQGEGDLVQPGAEAAGAAVRRRLFAPWEGADHVKLRHLNVAEARTEAGVAAACVRVPCSMEAEELHPCIMLHGLPQLGHKRVHLSGGEPLPEGNTSYRVPYSGQAQQRLEVAWLRAPTEVGGGEAEQPAVSCSPGPRPRLSVPWCSY